MREVYAEDKTSPSDSLFGLGAEKKDYEKYFMQDGLIEEKQKAIYVFDLEFRRILDVLILALHDSGYMVSDETPIHVSAPVSSAISVLGLMALDCKVSDPYILGSILER